MNPYDRHTERELYDEYERAARDDKSEKKSASTILVEIAQERYAFGVSETGETYAVPHQDPRVVLMLRGGKTSLRGQLARTYFTRMGKAAPQQALADALLVIEGIAQEKEAKRLYLRASEHDGAIWLDLGDQTGRAIQVTGQGWTIEDRVPVLFKRTALNGPLPEPVHGGKLDELWPWLNVAEDDRPLVVAWLVSVLFCDIPHPILGLFGEQGTGKTTAEKILVLLLDPGPVPIRKTSRDAESWVTAAAGSWIVGLDNLSDIPAWLSDSLCRAVTGEGDVRRKLYTDGEFAVFAFRRCIILSGIDVGAMAGDLAERMLPIDLRLIAEQHRIRETNLWPRWAAVHPRILGALLDLTASVLEVLPSVRLGKTPRMADFAHIVAAVDTVLGTAGLARYVGKQKSVATDALTGDLFITALEENIVDTFEGTAAKLLELATRQDELWMRPKSWPGTPRAVTQRLKRQAPPMRKAGWTIEHDDGANHSNVVKWTIKPPARTREARIPDSQPPQPSQEGSGREHASHASHEHASSHEDKPMSCAVCGEPVDPAAGDFHPACEVRPR